MTDFNKHTTVKQYSVGKGLFEKLWRLRPEEEQFCHMFGKTIKLPRRMINYTTNNSAYTGFVGGESNKSAEHPPPLLAKLLSNLGFEASHNNILLNFYADGEDYIGKHHDKTKGFADPKNFKIWSFSLFEESDDYRVMRFTKKGERHDIKLTNGTMVCFDQDANKQYKHEVLKKKGGGRRINITVRMFA